MAGCAPTLRTMRTLDDASMAGIVGAASAFISIAGSWIPSLWGDEAASIMSARRDWSSLIALLGTVDAVHGLYYALLHLWMDLVGASPFAVRLPSGLAVGAASAGLYLLVRRRADRGVAVVAAVLFAVLPRVTYLATEARSMALATAAAVWLTVLLLRLLDRPARRAWWIGYGSGLALGASLFLYLSLLIPVHVVVVAHHALRHATSESRWTHADGLRIRSFALAWAGAALLSAPIVLVALRQREQIAFRGHRDDVTTATLLVMPWFMLVSVAVVAWSLVLLAVIAAWRHRRDPVWRGRRDLLVLAIAWIVVPAAALLAVTALFAPVFTPRYLAICAPGAAIAMAVGVSALRRRWLRVGAVAATLGLAIPAYVDQRTPYAKNGGTDWQAVSATVDELAEPGDGIVFDEQVRPSRRPRLAMYTYPEGFRGLVDLTIERPHHETSGLWDVTVPLATVTERLESVDRVVAISRSRQGTDADLAVLEREGFDLVERVTLESDTVSVYERRETRG